MSADFTPTLTTKKDLKPFRFWCQKVLPIVYDDSLTYYELLNKVVDLLNKTMEDVSLTIEDVEALHTAYEQLQNYVNDYFNNLDVQEEINDKLDLMAEDGTLSDLITPLIPALVSEWLEDNITPTSPPLDSSFTVTGAAADSKAVGDKGMVFWGELDESYTALEEVTTVGYYAVSTARFTALSDHPDGSFAGGYLIVQKTGSGKTIYQQLVDVVSNPSIKYSKLYTTGTTIWRTTYEYEGFDETFPFRGMISGTTFASNNQRGIYQVPSSSNSVYSDMTDSPTLQNGGTFGGGFMIVTTVGAGSTVMQWIVDIVKTPVVTYWRSGTAEWKVDGSNPTAYRVKWCAIGDSITYGVYSEIQEGGTVHTVGAHNKAWCYYVSRILQTQSYSNKGIRGMGWIDTSNNGEHFTTDILPTIDFTQYDLVTIMLGINDYTGAAGNLGDVNSTPNDGTVCGALYYTIQYIANANPNCKVIIITPINRSDFGSESTNYARGYQQSARIGTLDNMTDKLIECCKNVGVEYIDMTRTSIINKYNAPEILLDGLHPSEEGHKLIARELWKKINWC